MDLERWKEKYSFLKNVFGMFEKYNRNVNVEKGSVYNSCYSIWVRGVWYGSKYNEFCEKLIRNIRIIDDPSHEDIPEFMTSKEHAPRAEESHGFLNKNVQCSYLNKWIYYYIYKEPVSDDFIKRIFEITHNMLKVNPSSYKCKFESLNEDYLEPHNVIKLSFFADYTENILGILNNDGHQDYSACLKYILECVAIYKKMKNDHCTNYDIRNEKYVKTCTELQEFKSTYDRELSKVQKFSENLPKLDGPLTIDEERILLEQEEYDTAQNGFSSTLQRTITTGAATAAGTGALLLALNKFTPVGSWLRSGKRRTAEVENILEGGPSEELFLNDPDYMHMNSDTASYNVGYGSTGNY